MGAAAVATIVSEPPSTMLRAAAERRQPLDRAQGRVLGEQGETLGREAGGQVVEVGALGDLVGRTAVDRVDADERGVALRAARRANRAGDPVAGDQLTAADL